MLQRVALTAALSLLTLTIAIRSQERWTDKSPHREAFTTVNGVKLHHLDWGGKGKVLLFLTGASNSAHIYDDFAPAFTDKFHVIALTRRGHGHSDKPVTGYDTATLVEDIRQFLDAMKIKRVSMVGHSLAGDEMTRFAGLYPERVDRLVYLDAAYDRRDLPRAKNPFPPPPPTAADRANMTAYQVWWTKNRGFWSDAVGTDLRETSLQTDGTFGSSLSPTVGQGIFKGTMESHPDYTKVKAPSLAFYATYSIPPWVPADAASQAKAQEFLTTFDMPYQRKNIDKFKAEAKKGKVIEYQNSNHYVFITNKDQVIQEMRRFLK